jgi:cobalt-zinc-cadmium efflux system protein
MHLACGHHRRGENHLRLVLILTVSFLGAEVVGGLLSNSLALLSDAGHMSIDTSALLLALFAARQARRPPDRKRTYGYRRVEVLAALANGILLVAIAAVILWEAWQRLGRPPEVRAGLMLAVASGGLVINIVGMWLLWSNRKDNLNLQAAYFHLAGDALGSVGAIAAAVVIQFTGWTRADAAASALIALLILWGAGRLIRESLHYLLEGAPRHIAVGDVEHRLCEVPGVIEIHDLHLWRISTGLDVLTAHVVVEDVARWREAQIRIRQELRDNFGLVHSTLQIEGREVLGSAEHEEGVCDG